MSDRAVLQVAGVDFGGWTELRISDSIENAAGSFAFGAVLRWNGEVNPIRIRPGDRCGVWLGDDLVITGYVDSVAPDGDDKSTKIAVAGRSATGDLVDCSAFSGSFAGLRIEEIAQKLANPYKIAVVAQVNTGAVFGRKARRVKRPNLNIVETVGATLQTGIGTDFGIQSTLQEIGSLTDLQVTTSVKGVDTGAAVVGHTVQAGESVFESVSRMAAKRALLVTDDPAGRLVLTRVGIGKATTILRRGGPDGNIKSGGAKFDASKVFSEIVVKGQSAGGDQTFGDDCLAAGTAVDPGLARFRRLTLHASGHTSAADCLVEAQWEVRNRLGKSCEAEYVVAGWRQADGTLWRKNLIVAVDDPLCSLFGKMLIAAVEYQLTPDGGSTTKLKLTLAAAFVPKPLPTGSGKGKAREQSGFWQEIAGGVDVRGAGPSAAQLRASKGKPKPVALDAGDAGDGEPPE